MRPSTEARIPLPPEETTRGATATVPSPDMWASSTSMRSPDGSTSASMNNTSGVSTAPRAVLRAAAGHRADP